MGSVLRDLGKRIRLLRKSRRLTQEQLAARASLDYKYLGEVERGRKNISVESLARIASALRVQVVEFFLFGAPAGDNADRVTEATVMDALRRSDPRMREPLLRILYEVLRVGRGE